MRPSERQIRIAAGIIILAGLAAAAAAILADVLGLGPEAGQRTFGWKRIILLGVGAAAAAIGALLWSRPRIVSWGIDRWRAGPARTVGYLAIGLLVLLGLVLVWTRLVRIDASLWHDEAFTVMHFSGVGPRAILLDEFSFNNHALYNLLSWFTVSSVGESDAIYRLWSVMPGIAAIAIGTWWAWRRIGPVASIAFATIAVAGPLHLEYTTQARGYGLALLAATLTLIAADRLTRAYSIRTLMGFVGAGLVGIWTLPIFAIAFVGQAMALLKWRRLRLPVIVAVGAAGALSVAFYAPVLGDMAGAGVSGTRIPLVAALLLDRPLEWLVVPTATLLTGEGERAALGGSGVTPAAPAVALLDVAALALLVLGLVALWRRGDLGLALILVVPPLLFNLVLSLGEMTTVERHQLFLLPYVVVPVAVGIAELGRLAARNQMTKGIALAVGVVAVVALSAAMVQEQEHGVLPQENFKQVARVVEGTGIETVVTDSNKPDGLQYYLGERLWDVPEEWVDRLLCEPRRQLVFIHHPEGAGPFWSEERLRCLARNPGIRIRVPQRGRGFHIDVWIIDPRVSRETVEDDLTYARER